MTSNQRKCFGNAIPDLHYCLNSCHTRACEIESGPGAEFNEINVMPDSKMCQYQVILIDFIKPNDRCDLINRKNRIYSQEGDGKKNTLPKIFHFSTCGR